MSQILDKLGQSVVRHLHFNFLKRKNNRYNNEEFDPGSG